MWSAKIRPKFLENLHFPYIFCNSTVSNLHKMYAKITNSLKTHNGRLCTQNLKRAKRT